MNKNQNEYKLMQFQTIVNRCIDITYYLNIIINYRCKARMTVTISYKIYEKKAKVSSKNTEPKNRLKETKRKYSERKF